MKNIKVYKKGKWKDIELKDLKMGDIFQVWNNGVLYEDEGKIAWLALGNAHLTDGVWRVEAADEGVDVDGI